MNMEKGTMVAILSLSFMLFVQACTGIWWASRITTTQANHSQWIADHQNQQQDYPVLVNRVTNLEANTAELVTQLKEFLVELREIKEIKYE